MKGLLTILLALPLLWLFARIVNFAVVLWKLSKETIRDSSEEKGKIGKYEKD